MAQGDLFKGMSDAELQQKAIAAAAAEDRKTSKPRGTRKRAAKKARATIKRKRAAKKHTGGQRKPAKRFYSVQVPVGANVSITAPCRTPKKKTPSPKKKSSSKKATRKRKKTRSKRAE